MANRNSLPFPICQIEMIESGTENLPQLGRVGGIGHLARALRTPFVNDNFDCFKLGSQWSAAVKNSEVMFWPHRCDNISLKVISSLLFWWKKEHLYASGHFASFK